MTSKVLLITGGTGGHVIPATNFANYLIDQKIDCKIIIDERGFKYINKFNGKVAIVKSSNLYGNFFLKCLGLLDLLIGSIQSFFIILFYKPTIVISFGSYSSFFPMVNCLLLKPFIKMKIYIHEQNSIIGRTNKIFLRHINKLFLNFEITTNLSKQLAHKTHIVGLPEKINQDAKFIEKKHLENFTIFIFGGSQGSKYITDISTKIIKIIDQESIIKTNFIIQCPKNMISKLSNELNEIKSKILIKDYYNNIEEILQKTSVAISRAGAGSVRNLINFQVPSVLIPLPSSKDNHQFHNALIMEKYNLALTINQNNNEVNEIKKYIYNIYSNRNNTVLNKEKFNKIIIKNSNSLIYKLIFNEK